MTNIGWGRVKPGKYRIGLNIVRTGEIGVKGLFLEYGEYSAEYSPTRLDNVFVCDFVPRFLHAN